MEVTTPIETVVVLATGQIVSEEKLKAEAELAMKRKAESIEWEEKKAAANRKVEEKKIIQREKARLKKVQQLEEQKAAAALLPPQTGDGTTMTDSAQEALALTLANKKGKKGKKGKSKKVLEPPKST